MRHILATAVSEDNFIISLCCIVQQAPQRQAFCSEGPKVLAASIAQGSFGGCRKRLDPGSTAKVLYSNSCKKHEVAWTSGGA
mmetsp:Transcript_27824/g.64236  ORF Transcript_27824/g.64236 Transcript_27824/m.64236 type:complete len:82 (+) Transcript_27824:216-461(+)